MQLSGVGRKTTTRVGSVYPSGTPSGSRRLSTPSTLNIILIPATLVMGIVSWILGNIMYNAMIDTFPRAILIGIIFFLLGVVLFVGVMIVSMLTNAFEGNVLTNGSGQGGVILFGIVALIALLLLGSLFQWLYSLNLRKETTEPTSYIFVIDDSGTTKETDPNQLRYQAINEVLAGMDEDFPFMIYGFSSSAYILRDMEPISEGIPSIIGQSEGGTAIRGTLEQVMKDYQNQVWDGGAYPRVILLTDGYAGDIGWFRSISPILKQYVKERISISTVGLDEVDEKLMKQIADTTGGVFISVRDAAGLGEAMQNAARMVASRDLLSARYMTSLNVLYGFLRVLFVCLLGICVTLITAVAYGNMESASIIMIVGTVKSLVGAIIMELGTGVFGISNRIAWLILWILLALTIGTKPSMRSGNIDRTVSRRPVQRPSASANKVSRRFS